MDGESVTKVLYGVKGTEQDMAFLTALGLTANDCYTPATKIVDGVIRYYYESDTLINALRSALAANATTVKDALETVVKSNGGTAMPETDASGLAEINAAATVYGGNSIYSGYSECYVRITYAATVNSDATVVYGDDGNPNDVTLEWCRTNTAYYDTLKDCCHLYTYGIQLNKRFSDNAGDYSEVSFTIQNTTTTTG